MTSKTCALCGSATPLRRSHLLPKALYRMCRSTRANPNPVAMGTKRAHLTSYQAASELLCATCEQRFSRLGETYVVGGCYRPNGHFMIRDAVLASEPEAIVTGWPFYRATSISTLDTEALRFFAASVFWRASVARWMVPALEPLRNSLGKYEKAFTEFLLGHSQFPAAARLLLWISSELDPPRMLTFPRVQRGSGHHSHDFYIPGLHFFLVVGGRLPTEIATPFKVRHDEVPIFLMNSRVDGAFSTLAQEWRRRPGEYKTLFAKAGRASV